VRRDATVRGAHGRVCRRAGATLALALSVCVCCIELEWIDARRPPWQPGTLRTPCRWSAQSSVCACVSIKVSPDAMGWCERHPWALLP
jgi:hypothetical protein